MAVPLPKPPTPGGPISEVGKALLSLPRGPYGSRTSPIPQNVPRGDIFTALRATPPVAEKFDWDPFWRPLEQVLNTITAGGQGVKNVIDKGVKVATTTDPSQVVNYLAHLGPVGDFTSGFLASIRNDTESENYVLGAELMENISDNVGKRFDPNYVDRENNIDPKLKFGVGLGIDIFTDPITYAPGGIFAAGIRGGVRSAQAAKGLSKIPEGIKGIKRGAPDLDYKIGAFSKRIKPTGYDEWKKVRSLEKVENIARKNNLPTEGVLALGAVRAGDQKMLERVARQFTEESPIGKTWTVDEVAKLQQKVQGLRVGLVYPIKGTLEGAENVLMGRAKSAAYAAGRVAQAGGQTVGRGYMEYGLLDQLGEAGEAQYQALRAEAVRRTKRGFLNDARATEKRMRAAAETMTEEVPNAAVRFPSSADPESFNEAIIFAAQKALAKYRTGDETLSPNEDIFSLIDGLTESNVGSTEAIARVLREDIRRGNQLDLTLTGPSGKEYRMSELMDAIIDGNNPDIPLSDIDHLSRLAPRLLENIQTARKTVEPMDVNLPKADPETAVLPAEQVVIDPMGVPRPVGTLRDLVDMTQTEVFADQIAELKKTLRHIDSEIFATTANNNVKGFIYDVNVNELKPGMLEAALKRAGITVAVDARALPNYTKNLEYVHLKQDRLQPALEKMGIKYIPAGAKLGDRPGNAAFYVDGNPTYSTIKDSPEWQQGVDELVAQMKPGDTVAILHFGERGTRDTLVTRLLEPELNNRGYVVKHVRTALDDSTFQPEGLGPQSERLRRLYAKRAEVKEQLSKIFAQTIKADSGPLLPGASADDIARSNRAIVSAQAHLLAGQKRLAESPLNGIKQVDIEAWATNVKNIADESAVRLAKDGAKSVEAQSILLTKLLALHGQEDVQKLLDRLVIVSGGMQKGKADLTDIGDAAMFIEKVVGSRTPFGTFLESRGRFEPDVINQEFFEAIQALAALKTPLPGYTDKARALLDRYGIGLEPAWETKTRATRIRRAMAEPGKTAPSTRYVTPKRGMDIARDYREAVEANPGARVNIFGEVVDDKFVAEELNRIIDNVANDFFSSVTETPDIPTGQSVKALDETLNNVDPTVSANDLGRNVVHPDEYLRRVRQPRFPVKTVGQYNKKTKTTNPFSNPLQESLIRSDYALTNSRVAPAATPKLRKPFGATKADEASAQLPAPPSGSLKGKKITVQYSENVANGKPIEELAAEIKSAYERGATIHIPELPENNPLVGHMRRDRVQFTVFLGQEKIAEGQQFKFFEYFKFPAETRPVTPTFNAGRKMDPERARKLKLTPEQIAAYEKPNNQQDELKDLYDHIVGFARQPLPNPQSYVQALHRIAGNTDPDWQTKFRAREVLKEMGVPYTAESRGIASAAILREAATNPKVQQRYFEYVAQFEQLGETDPVSGLKKYAKRRAGIDIFGQLWHDTGKGKGKRAEEIIEKQDEFLKANHPYSHLPDGDAIWDAVQTSRRRTVPFRVQTVKEPGKKVSTLQRDSFGRQIFVENKDSIFNLLVERVGMARAYEVMPLVRQRESERLLNALNLSTAAKAEDDLKSIAERGLQGDPVYRRSSYTHMTDVQRQAGLQFSLAGDISDLSRAMFNGDIENLAEYWGGTVRQTQFQYNRLVRENMFNETEMARIEQILRTPNVIEKLFAKRVNSEIRVAGGEQPIEVDFMRDPGSMRNIKPENRLGTRAWLQDESGALAQFNIAEGPGLNSFIEDIAQLVKVDPTTMRPIVVDAIAAVGRDETGTLSTAKFISEIIAGLRTQTTKIKKPLTREEVKLYNEGKLVEKISRDVVKERHVALNLPEMLREDRAGLLGDAWREYDQNFVQAVANSLLGRSFETNQATVEFLRSRNLSLRGLWDTQRSNIILEREFISETNVFNADEIRAIVESPNAFAQIDEMIQGNSQRVTEDLNRVSSEGARALIQNAGVTAFRRSVAKLGKGEQYVNRLNVIKNIQETIGTKFKAGTPEHWNATVLALSRYHDIALSTGAFPVTKLSARPAKYVTASPQSDWAYLSFMDVYRSLVSRDRLMDDLFRTGLENRPNIPLNIVEEAAVFAIKMHKAEVTLPETRRMLLAEFMRNRLITINGEAGEKIDLFKGDTFEAAYIARLANWLSDDEVAGELLQRHNMYAAGGYRIADENSGAIIEPIREMLVTLANSTQRNAAASYEALDESINMARAALKERGFSRDTLENVLTLQKLQKVHVENFTPIDISAARHSTRILRAVTDEATEAEILLRQRKIAELYAEGRRMPENMRKAALARLDRIREIQNTERASLAADTIEQAKDITREDTISMIAQGAQAGDQVTIAAGVEKAINIAEHVESTADDLQNMFTLGPVHDGFYDLTAQHVSRGTRGTYAENLAAEARRPQMAPESLREAIEATPEDQRLPGTAFERESRTTSVMTAMSGRAVNPYLKHMQVTEEAGLDAIRNMYERGLENLPKQGQQIFENDADVITFGWDVIIGTFGTAASRKGLEQIATTPEQFALGQKIIHAARTLFDPQTAHTLALTGLDTNYINEWLLKGPLTHKSAQLIPDVTGLEAATTIPIMLENVYKAWANGAKGTDWVTMLKGYNFALRNAQKAPNIAARFSAQFGNRGLGYETVKDAIADGLVQPKVGRGQGTLFRWLDKSQAYPPEMLTQIRALEKFLDYETELKGGLDKLLGALDKPTTVIKSSLTLWKLGHHVVSAMGEAFMNVLAGVYNPYRYAQAYRALKAGGEFKSGSIFGENILDLESWAATYSERALKTPGEKGIAVRVGNKTTVVPYEAFYREFMRRGAGISANVAEDLLVQSDEIVKAGGSLSKLTRPLVNINQGLAEFSARRDNLFRLAHAIDMVSKRSFRSVDEMWETIGMEITQWHPTMQSLSGFERKYMRRIIFFYTWMRNAANKVVESIVERPQAFVFAPKVNYAISGMMGGDPQSYGQPAPNDPRIADFYARQALGPAWYTPDGDVVGISINAPQLDILQTLIGGIQIDPNLPIAQQIPGGAKTFFRENVIGIINPIAKGAVEIGYGTEMRPYGAVPIEDVGEYITDLTGLGYLSRATGTAFINEKGFLQPRVDRETDPIRQMEKQQRTVFNALTGVRYAEYSQYWETAKRQRDARNKQYLEQMMKNFRIDE